MNTTHPLSRRLILQAGAASAVLQRAGTADKEKVIEALTSSTWFPELMPYGPTKFVNGQNEGGRGALLQASKTDIDVAWPNQFASAKATFPRPKLG